jgi:xylulokinase
MDALYLGHDVGTSGCKAVLVDRTGRVLASHTSHYPLHHPHPGWAEQDPGDWWAAVGTCSRAVMQGVDPAQLRGMAFAGQMLALVPMDRSGTPTRPAISWLDHRAEQQARRITRRLGGATILGMLAGATPTGKDLVAKLAWLAQNEPDVHARTAAYGDATSYLVARATGELAIDPAAAGCTGALDLGRRRWSRLLSRLVRFDASKWPRIVASSARVGGVTAAAAEVLGVPEGLPVAMGTADIPAAAVGAGAVTPGATHIYLGTSSWVGVSLDRQASIPKAGIASVPSAARTGCLLIAESETAGACRDWFAQHFELDHAAHDALASEAPPGSDGLLFCPWLFGERSPFPDAQLRGAFVNVGLEHTRAHLARAVLEGVALNLRWILATIDPVVKRTGGLRVLGGGARSDLWLQILADVTGETCHRVAEPQHAGAVGAALLAAVAVGDLPDVPAIASTVQIDRAFSPTPGVSGEYERLYRAMRELAPALSRASRTLHRAS